MFQFATATQIIFGSGSLKSVATPIAALGRSALLVTGKGERHREQLLEYCADHNLGWEHFQVSGEPTIDVVQAGLALARNAKVDCIVGLGGGSVLDAGKAIAGLLHNPGEPLDYLEVIGRGQKLERPAAPYVAIPTTSGTGAEVTKNAVLASIEHQVKVSLRSDSMLPRLALLDPELTTSKPPSLTASTGMDALTQVIEPYVSCLSNPLTDAISRAGIAHGRDGLLAAYRDGQDICARERMALCSLFGGLALANSKLGAVHGFAGPLGGLFPAPHGAVCAALLPAVTRMNIRQLRSEAHPTLSRYQEVAAWLTHKPNAEPEAAADYLENLKDELQIPPLGHWGVTTAQTELIVQKAQAASSMKGNPVVLTQAQLAQVLEESI